MSDKTQLGINITEEKLQIVELNFTNDNFYLENIDEEYFEEFVNAKTKQVKFINILQNSFNEILLRNTINSTKSFVSLPLSFFKTFEIPAEQNLTNSDFNEYIEWEFSKLYPELNKKDYTIQYHLADSKKKDYSANAFVFAIEKSILKSIHQFSIRNNLKLKNIDNAHIAATSFLQLKNNKENQLCFFVDNHRISVVLRSGNKFLYYKQKEHKIISEIPLLAKDLFDELEERYLKYDTLENFILSGNVYSEKLKSTLETSLNLSAEIINPFDTIKPGETLTENKFVQKTPVKFSAATGMALRLA